MTEYYADHHAQVTVNAPVHQVYALFSHFNDFPKFMTFVKEVTYYDDRSSHWAADVAGHHEWDAVNDTWIPDQQIGWHSTKGLENSGKVTFAPVGNNQTRIDVDLRYNPPAGILGNIGEKLGAGSHFENVLEHDLQHFARMVDEAPVGALDPNSSNYLFHGDSAAAKGKTTARQEESMQNDPNIGRKASASEQDRPMMDRDITGQSSTTMPPDSSGTDMNQNLPPDQSQGPDNPNPRTY
ncbi:MAG TPA: SRPBCC family protein [Ktedonobacteraceae bacterium]|nr:SRPBCC family protein [Ktedonobacteraceae bacterium]